jgi:hypothetical protein
MMTRLTLLIHPFFFSKRIATWEHVRDTRDVYGQKSHMPEEISTLLKRRTRNEIAREGLKRYMEGVEYSRHGLLAVFRAQPYDLITDEEAELFEGISKISGSFAYIYPARHQGRRGADSPEDISTLNSFLSEKLGSLDEISEVELHSFGEDVSLCVAFNTRRVRALYDITKRPRILVKYSCVSPERTFDDALQDLRRYNPGTFDILK